MSRALAWLQRHRAIDAAPAAPMSSSPPEPTALDVLHRLRERRAVTTVRSIAADRALPGTEVAPGLWRFDQHRPWPLLPTALQADWTTLGEIDAARLRLFDSETTGLAGGTGTRAFMLGIGRGTGDGLHLTQFSTSTLAAERHLLEAFLAEVPRETVLVSYNGKCYDRPLLSTRLRLSRMADPLIAMPHLDLLHPTRRRMKHLLSNCRLATVERQWLGIVREDDLPGSEAPAAWLSYLRGGSSKMLWRVAEHNAQDLVSLAALLKKLTAPAQESAGDTHSLEIGRELASAREQTKSASSTCS